MSKETEKACGDRVFISSALRMQAVACEEKGLKIFRWQGFGEEPEFVREYGAGEVAVMHVSFAPLQYRPYLLALTNDLRVLLFNLAEKQTDPVFEFAEESGDAGYFTTAEFFDSHKDALKFAVGTSSGTVLVFSSEKNFQEDRVRASAGAVKALAAGPREMLAAACTTENPRVYFDAYLSAHVEFGQTLHDSKKVSLLAFQRGASDDDALLLTTGEDLKVGLWRVDAGKKTVAPVGAFALSMPPVAVGWDFSGLAATVVLTKKTAADEHISFCRIEKNLVAELEEWTLREVTFEK